MKYLNAIFISCILILSACKQDLNKKISGTKYKIWECCENMSLEGYYYSFWSNGSWFILYKDIDGNFRKLDTGDNILYEKWKLMEDCVIFIGGHKFMIRRITNKEMLLERNNKVGRLKFIK